MQEVNQKLRFLRKQVLSNRLRDRVRAVDKIFRRVMHNTVQEKIEVFLTELRSIKWFANSGKPVEKMLDMPGFSTALTGIYRQEYFPCSRIGKYPSSQSVVV